MDKSALIEEFEKLKQKYNIETEIGDSFDIEHFLNESVEELEKEIYQDSMKHKLFYEKLSDEVNSPSYAYDSDSGFDLCSTEKIIIESFGRALVPTGLKFNIPIGYEIQVRPKSGLALKQGLTVLNTPGTVDSGYNGEVKVIVFNTNKESFTIEKGMKIAQAVLCPVACGRFVRLIKVDNVEETDRGSNGFGSTGINI